jgi:hypothetical protein
LYVSLEYATAIHACACGCGNEVVTPLSPNGWKLTFEPALRLMRPIEVVKTSISRILRHSVREIFGKIKKQLQMNATA